MKTANTDIFEKKYKDLNVKQKEAVDTIYGPVMVVAGPGTGKTTVLTLRIANILLKTDAKPEEILALTFTDSGVRSMREKLRAIIGDASFRVNLFTFHSFANHIRALFPEYFEKIGGRLPSSDSDAIVIIEDILKSESFKELRPSTYGVKVRDISKRIGELKKEAILPNDLAKLIEKEKKAHKAYVNSLEKINKTTEGEIEKKEKYILRLEEFLVVYRRYEEELEKRELYDFDDTILGLLDALKKHPDLLAEVRESFQFVLADEHQDANGSQNEILKFFRGVELDALDPPNLFVVGDDKQSIFRFQGASLENFYNFEQDFPGAKKIDLSENYRSHSNILGLAHNLIINDGRTHTDLQANVPYSIKPIEVSEYESFEDELSGTVEKIKEELKADNTNNIAVITRTNGALFELARYLKREKIDFTLTGEKSLFETDAYLKLLFLFEALVNPMADDKFIRSIYLGYFKINLHDILALENYAKKRRKAFADVLLKGDFEEVELHDPEALSLLQSEIEDLISSARKLPLLHFLKKLGGRIFDNNDSEGLVVLRDLFLEADKLVIKQRNALLKEFVEYLLLLEKHNISPIIPSKERKTRLELISIHKSKGLEYDIVHILDVTDKKFEKSGRRSDLLRIPGVGVQRDIEEDRRLLYVAVTRAKKHAVISYSLKGLEGQSQVPSVLIDELLPELIKKEKIKEGTERISLFEAEDNININSKKVLQEEFLSRSFSVTALNNYLSCPWKYFFRNLLQVPDVKEFSAMLGTACHEALRAFHHLIKKGEKVSEKELKKIINNAVLAQAFSKSELPVAISKAEENIFAYVKSFSSFREGEVAHIEEKISFPFEVKGNEGIFEIIITGVLDLVLVNNSQAIVIDFKTKKRMTKNEILGNTKSSDGSYFRQLQFYKFLWEGGSKDSTVEQASLVFLSPERGNVSTETFELKDNDKDEIREIVKNTLSEIHSLSFWNKKCSEKDCEYCRLANVFKGEN